MKNGVMEMSIEILNSDLYEARYMTRGSDIRYYPVMFGDNLDIDLLRPYIDKKNSGKLSQLSLDGKNSVLSIVDDQIVITISNDAEAGLMRLSPGFRSGPSAGRGRGRGRGRGPGPGRSGGSEGED